MITLNASASHYCIVTILAQELLISHSLTSLTTSANEWEYIITDNLYCMAMNRIINMLQKIRHHKLIPFISREISLRHTTILFY